MSRPTKAQILATVVQALREDTDVPKGLPPASGEAGSGDRFLILQSMLQSIDWGTVPLAAVEEVLATIVRVLPHGHLVRGFADEPGGLYGWARGELSMWRALHADTQSAKEAA